MLHLCYNPDTAMLPGAFMILSKPPSAPCQGMSLRAADTEGASAVCGGSFRRCSAVISHSHLRDVGRHERAYVPALLYELPYLRTAHVIQSGVYHARPCWQRPRVHVVSASRINKYLARAHYVCGVIPLSEARPVVSSYHQHELPLRKVAPQSLQRAPCVRRQGQRHLITARLQSCHAP